MYMWQNIKKKIVEGESERKCIVSFHSYLRRDISMIYLKNEYRHRDEFLIWSLPPLPHKKSLKKCKLFKNLAILFM